MADLIQLPNRFHPKKAVCRAIIETPKGSRNKFNRLTLMVTKMHSSTSGQI
jgi:hypothetical protein